MTRKNTEIRLCSSRRLAVINECIQSPWTAFHLPSFSRRRESIGPMKTKNGPPLFSEGDEGGESGVMWGSRWRRPFFPSFSRRRESIGAMKTKNGPPLFSEGDKGGESGVMWGSRWRRPFFPSFSRRRESRNSRVKIFS
jgi:hypothetical protein